MKAESAYFQWPWTATKSTWLSLGSSFHSSFEKRKVSFQKFWVKTSYWETSLPKTGGEMTRNEKALSQKPVLDLGKTAEHDKGSKIRGAIWLAETWTSKNCPMSGFSFLKFLKFPSFLLRCVCVCVHLWPSQGCYTWSKASPPPLRWTQTGQRSEPPPAGCEGCPGPKDEKWENRFYMLLLCVHHYLDQEKFFYSSSEGLWIDFY